VDSGGAITGFTFSSGGAWTSGLGTTLKQVDASGPGTGFTCGPATWAKTSSIIGQTSARPNRLEGGFIRQPQGAGSTPIDYPLGILESRQDFNRIKLKTMQSLARVAFYDNAWPLGQIHLWPVPQAGLYQIFLTFRCQLPVAFIQQTDYVNLPFEYFNAIVQNLSIRMFPIFGQTVDQGSPLVGLARDALNALNNSNTQIPQLVMPGELLGSMGNYDPYSDTIT
jgi:hypothetical protein